MMVCSQGSCALSCALAIFQLLAKATEERAYLETCSFRGVESIAIKVGSIAEDRQALC